MGNGNFKKTVIEPRGKLTHKDIIDLETQLGFTLPDDYKEFLKENNGGYPDVNVDHSFYVEDANNEETGIEILYGYKTGADPADILLWMKEYGHKLPPKTVIIGNDYAHGFLLICCEGEDDGVYLWDHTYSFPTTNEDENTYYLCGTFSELIGIK